MVRLEVKGLLDNIVLCMLMLMFPNAGCYAVGLLPLIVAVGALGLMFVQYFQLARLRDHLRNPEMSSDEYRYTCRKMFWRMVTRSHRNITATN